MDLKELIRAKKTDVELSKWTSGRVPRSAFPQSLVKERWYRLGKSYHWRTVKFRADGKDCRVLMLINEDKSIFRARLGVEKIGDMIIMCDHEWHASEPGWHCHINRRTVDKPLPVRPETIHTSGPNAPFLICSQLLAAMHMIVSLRLLAFPVEEPNGFENRGSLPGILHWVECHGKCLSA